MATRLPIVEYIIKYQSSLINIDMAKDLWMIPDRLFAKSKQDTSFVIDYRIDLYIGKLFVYENEFYAVESFKRIDNHDYDMKSYTVVGDKINVPYNEKLSLPLCTCQTSFIMKPNEIANYKGDKDVETTIGRFVANYLFLVYPFNDKIFYLNEEFTGSKLEGYISALLLNKIISVSQVKDRYINVLTLFGQANEMICPNITEKTIDIPPEIAALRQKLVKDNKEALANGDATVMSQIEQTLIQAYRDHLKGDPSLHFLLNKKYFNVTLKKLFLTHGMVEVFGSPGKYTFVDNPMGDGWKVKDLPTIFNEVRQGSFSRAIETADGGVIAKLITRVLQDISIVSEDCHTTRGEKVFATKEALDDFMHNYVIEPNGKTTCITNITKNSFLGKNIVIRTPGYCEENPGFCAKCFGKIFEDLGQKALSSVAIGVGGQIVTLSLKKMHGTQTKVQDVSDLNKFTI